MFIIQTEYLAVFGIKKYVFKFPLAGEQYYDRILNAIRYVSEIDQSIILDK